MIDLVCGSSIIGRTRGASALVERLDELERHLEQLVRSRTTHGSLPTAYGMPLVSAARR